MNHDSAVRAIDALFQGQGRKRAELRAHLDGCLECRAHFDRTARAFRAASGRLDEMTAEELWLFEPVLPEAAPAPSRLRPMLAAAFATAGLVALVVVLSPRAATDGFSPRGTNLPTVAPGARAFCTRGDGSATAEAARGGCQAEDRLLFSVTGQGRPWAAVVLLEADRAQTLVGGADGKLAPGQPEVVLPQASTWRPGLRAVAVFSDAPIDAPSAERCARGDCASPLSRIEVPLTPQGAP